MENWESNKQTKTNKRNEKMTFIFSNILGQSEKGKQTFFFLGLTDTI